MTDRFKIICLNTWAGTAGADSLLAFFKAHQDVDIFCLQEMWDGGEEALTKVAAGRSLNRVDPHIYGKIKTALPEYAAYFREQYISYFGIAMFVRKSLSVIAEGSVCIYKEPGYVSPTDIGDHSRILQYVTIDTPRGPFTILNTHGAWQPVGKIDTPERLEQSERILKFTKVLSHPLVLCGDFNLLPETQSVKLLEEGGWENLIRVHGITSTRTRLYTKSERYADYIFVKNNVRVHDFRVLPDEVSDHAPLYLECSIT